MARTQAAVVDRDVRLEGAEHAAVASTSGRPNLFTAQCKRYKTSFGALVLLALCSVSFMFYQEIPVGHYQDLDSVSMLYDYRRSSPGIAMQHEEFKRDCWSRDVAESDFGRDVATVSYHIAVARYCGGSPALCQGTFQVKCLSTLDAVNATHSLSAGGELVEGVALLADCAAFNALPLEDRVGRLTDLHLALEGYDPFSEPEPPTMAQWDQWACNNWAAIQNVESTCRRAIDLCQYVDAAIEAIALEEAALNFFRVARSASCDAGPLIEVYQDGSSVDTWNLTDRLHGWVSEEEVRTFFAASLEARYGADVQEPYARRSIEDQLVVAGQGVSLAFVTQSSGALDPASYAGMTLFSFPACTNTAYSALSGAGTIDVSVDGFSWDRTTMLDVTLGGASYFVPVYRADTDFETNATTVKRLTSLSITVVKSDVLEDGDQRWLLSEVAGGYAAMWSGDVAAAEEQVGADAISLAVILGDLSAPYPLHLPALVLEYYTFVALAVGAVAFIILALLPVVLYNEYKKALVEAGLPLPFFKYTTQFRGW